MRFHQLSMGQRFEFEGEIYVRTKPLLAVHEVSGKQRFIRRSASVRAMSQEAAAEPAQAPAAAAELEREAVLEAFDAFYARCLLGLEEVGDGVDSESVERIRDNLREARRRFLDSLSL